jgi:hypothetical protein
MSKNVPSKLSRLERLRIEIMLDPCNIPLRLLYNKLKKKKIT